MARMTPEQAADELLGTARTLREVAGEDIDTLPRQWCHELDTLVMCCDCCGWWVASDEINDDQNCEQCAEDE